MGHSIGISDSYYRATDIELLDDYLRAVPILAISNEHRLQKQMEDAMERSRENDVNIKSELHEKGQELAALAEKDSMNIDAISALSEKVMNLMKEIEILKKNKAGIPPKVYRKKYLEG